MEKRLSDPAKRGFVRLLEEASRSTKIRGLKYANLNQHPFSFKIPANMHLAFVGIPGSSEFTNCFARLVAEKMTNGFLGGNNEVSFIRICKVQCSHFDRSREDVYYEVGVRGTLFMTGGCTYYSGSGEYSEIECLISFLSKIYQVPVYRNDIPLNNYHLQEKLLMKDLNDSWQDFEERVNNWWEKQKSYRIFKIGDSVKWNPDVSSAPTFLGGFEQTFKISPHQRYEILDVEQIPNYCSCGIGEEQWICLHPEYRCHLRKRHEAAHHQIVTVNIGGQDHKMSGYYFDTNNLFS